MNKFQHAYAATTAEVASLAESLKIVVLNRRDKPDEYNAVVGTCSKDADQTAEVDGCRLNSKEIR